jgi:hypothetical protein
MEELNRLNPGPSNSKFFLRLDNGGRSTYEMMRTNTLKQGISTYSDLILFLLKKDENGQSLRADGSKLPPFTYVYPFLGNIGISFSSHPDGWSGVIVFLKK